jgi:hypothetical protein
MAVGGGLAPAPPSGADALPQIPLVLAHTKSRRE